MIRSILILAILSVWGCNSSKERKNAPAPSAETTEETSAEMNKSVPYENSIMLLGKTNRKGLQDPAFEEWFAPGYADYSPDPEIMEKLKPLIADVDITLFMGTWCEDSHRDVPHLYKILDQLGYDESHLAVFAVSEEKTTPQGYEDGRNIIQVPTIIFYRDGKELGRIVEYSIYTVERDMYDILSGKDYKNPYSE